MARLPTYIAAAAPWLRAFVLRAWRVFVAFVGPFLAQLPARVRRATAVILATWHLFAVAVGKGIGYVVLGLRWLSAKLSDLARWLVTDWPRVSSMMIDWMVNLAETAMDVGVAIQGWFWPVRAYLKDIARAFLMAAEAALLLGNAAGLIPREAFARAQQFLWPALRWTMTTTPPPDTSWYQRGYRWLEERRQWWKQEAAAAGQWLAPRAAAAGATAGQWANQVVVVVYANDLGVVGQVAQQAVERATQQQRRDRVRY